MRVSCDVGGAAFKYLQHEASNPVSVEWRAGRGAGAGWREGGSEGREGGEGGRRWKGQNKRGGGGGC
eukprot:766995-Hanusia_phi.AAC.1